MSEPSNDADTPSRGVNRLGLYIPLAIFITILGTGYVGFDLGVRGELPSALIGKPFPDFSADKLGNPGERVSKQTLLGRPTLVNVWATWCPTCKAEHAELMRIAAQTDVQLVGINYKDDPALALTWLEDYGDPYDWVLLDQDGSLGVELGVYGAPETFLLNAAGEVLYKRVGDVNPRIWRDEIAPRLRALGVRMQVPESEEQTLGRTRAEFGFGR